MNLLSHTIQSLYIISYTRFIHVLDEAKKSCALIVVFSFNGKVSSSRMQVKELIKIVDANILLEKENVS